MDAERSTSRRRFVSLVGAFGLAALAGCTEGEEDEGENETEDGSGEGENETMPGDEDESAAVDEEEELPEIEGTNLFIEVVDEEEGAPVPGVTVTVTGGTYDDREFETDAGGDVILQDVEPGDYVITATTEGGEDEAEVSLEEDEDANVSLEVPVPNEEETATDEDPNETEDEDGA